MIDVGYNQISSKYNCCPALPSATKEDLANKDKTTKEVSANEDKD